ncbi:MAG: hybrid sensor histidine kinase/response regulator [Sphingosinicella sp.]|nr:hybrid sensor histidine kinase/response regulator [Sphingosinicella sp.]
MDELLGDFLTETAENLQTVDNEIVLFERDPGNRDVLNNIFRLVHTIKGTCGFLNLPRLERLAHAAETVLGKVRDGQAAVSPAVVSETLAAIDGIKVILAALETSGKEPAGDDEAQIARLNAAIAILETPKVELVPEPVIAAEPDAGAGRGIQSIRVSVALLEQLMTTVSELVLTRNELLQHLRTLKDDRLAVPLQRLSAQVGELQESVMRTRMQPISNAWSALPRLVRSLSVELGKPIELDMQGGETELDRQLLELIKDPLAHMVRNAADHGIETTEQRKAAGKDARGRIVLKAAQEGGHIVITLADDGSGIDVARLKAKAVALRLVTETDAAQLSALQAQRLVFHPGLSTAEQVTSVSGRGVGMDVVRANIEKIGGAIDIESTAGKGTQFTIRIPLTLAILPALIVASGGQRFAVPQMAVVELVRVGANSEHVVEYVNNAAVMRLRGRLLPLIHLGTLLGIGNGRGGGDYVLIARAGNISFGLIVDNIFDTEEVVVKPVAPILKTLSVYSGNAILGDGAVIMILDANGIAASLGIAGESDASDALETPVREVAQETDAMLLFRAGSPHPKAVPLSLVARLEEFDAAAVEWSEGRPVVQYRDALVPLLAVDGALTPRVEGRQPALIFDDGAAIVALMVDEVLDIVDTHVDICMTSDLPARIGTAVIAGRATEILDVAHYLSRAGSAGSIVAEDKGGRRVLIVDDSAFFRNMLKPLLASAGYRAMTAASADEALALRETGEHFDLILSDIEMPGLSGVDFARAVRGDDRWRETPLVALSSLAGEEHVRQGEAAGFDQYVAKFDRSRLLDAVARQLSGEAA